MTDNSSRQKVVDSCSALDPVDHQLIKSKQDAIRERGELPRVFSIVTWGCAATSWLTKVLNSHPEIFCVHCLRAQLKLISPLMHDVSDADILAMIQILGSGHSLAGDVHGIQRESVASLLAVFGDEIRIAGLIRDPVKRLRSQFALFDSAAFDSNRWGDLGYVRAIDGFDEIRMDVGDDPSRIFFVHSANMLNAILPEAQILPRIFRQEDLTSKPEAMCELINYLSAGTLAPDDRYAARAVKTPVLHQHRGAEPPCDFEQWQIRIVNLIVQPEAWRQYAEFGYNLPKFIAIR